MKWKKPRLAALGVLLAGLLVSTAALADEPYHYQPLSRDAFTLLPVPLREDPRTPAPTLAPVVIVDSSALGPRRPTPAPIRSRTQPTTRPTTETRTSGATSTGRTLKGIASWYCLPGRSRCTRGHSGGLYAAIRRDLLYLRGKTVDVCSSRTRCVTVKIIDCNCGSHANLIDLYADAFRMLAPLSRGRISVTIRP